MAGCLRVVGHGLFGVCLPVLAACTLFVACRSSSSASVPTVEAAFAVRAASVLVHGVSVCVCVFGYVVACGCLRLWVVVTFFGVCCSCCGWWLLLLLWLWFVVVAVFVGVVP